jgi:hypothetical protein
MTRKLVILKCSLVLTVIFGFKLASQFVERYHII